MNFRIVFAGLLFGGAVAFFGTKVYKAISRPDMAQNLPVSQENLWRDAVQNAAGKKIENSQQFEKEVNTNTTVIFNGSHPPQAVQAAFSSLPGPLVRTLAFPENSNLMSLDNSVELAGTSTLSKWIANMSQRTPSLQWKKIQGDCQIKYYDFEDTSTVDTLPLMLQQQKKLVEAKSYGMKAYGAEIVCPVVSADGEAGAQSLYFLALENGQIAFTNSFSTTGRTTFKE